MLDLAVIAVTALLTTASGQTPECRSAEIYFESGRAELNIGAHETIDALYAGGPINWARASATIVGHIDGAERHRDLVSLDEARGAAIRARLEALNGDHAPASRWTFVVGGADDLQPARAVRPGAAEPLNRRARLIVCSTPG